MCGSQKTVYFGSAPAHIHWYGLNFMNCTRSHSLQTRFHSWQLQHIHYATYPLPLVRTCGNCANYRLYELVVPVLTIVTGMPCYGTWVDHSLEGAFCACRSKLEASYVNKCGPRAQRVYPESCNTSRHTSWWTPSHCAPNVRRTLAWKPSNPVLLACARVHAWGPHTRSNTLHHWVTNLSKFWRVLLPFRCLRQPKSVDRVASWPRILCRVAAVQHDTRSIPTLPWLESLQVKCLPECVALHSRVSHTRTNSECTQITLTFLT